MQVYRFDAIRDYAYSLDGILFETLTSLEFRAKFRRHSVKPFSLCYNFESTNPVLPHLTLPHLPCLTVPYVTLPDITLPYITLPYLILPCLTLPYLILPYLTLPYLSLPSPILL